MTEGYRDNIVCFFTIVVEAVVSKSSLKVPLVGIYQVFYEYLYDFVVWRGLIQLSPRGATDRYNDAL